jgi:hypothetical protein
MENPTHRPLLIGWKEHADFPDWDIRRVRVKVDTGARTSALDVLQYTVVPTTSGGQIVEMQLALDRRRPGRSLIIRAPVMKIVAVRNTSGQTEQRPLIETTIRLGPVCKQIHLTVTDRSSMRFPVILGRTALAGDFVVDVSRHHLLRT